MANQNPQTHATSESDPATGSSAREQSKNATELSPGKTQAQIDEEAKQTFPASDAPSSWAGKDIAPQDRKDAQKKS